MRAKYGVTVVLAGLGVVLVAFVAAAIIYSEAGDVSTALAPVTGVVGTLVGAYFGIQSGAQGREAVEDRADERIARVEEARAKAQDDAMRMAAIAPPGPAARVLGVDFGATVGPAAPYSGPAEGDEPSH